MRKIIDNKNLIITILVIAGVCTLSFPIVSNLYNSIKSSYAISLYNKENSNKSEAEYSKMFQNAREYNESLVRDINYLSNGQALSLYYLDQFKLSSGVMAYIKIDKIGVNLPIYHGSSDDVLQRGVGHIEGSSLPTGDIGNHTILTGHRGLPTAKLFTDLDELVIGDTFIIYVLNQIYKYEVTEIFVVEPNEIEKLAFVDDKSLVTLITCTPYGVNSHRLLIQAEKIN